jgi:acetylornithine deacetylase/succinyl-diaminopimelate desuccinylase-like protein
VAAARIEDAGVEPDPAWLDELFEFLRIPSVSADAAHAADVLRAGEWVRDFVRRAGGQAELVRTGAQPLAVGEIPASSGGDDAATVLVYGHFDVQPPAPLDAWESPPFEPTVRDGWIYARGAADDKGNLYLLLKAVATLAEEGRLPVHVRVACDGEEETGGHSIVDFL